MYPAISKSGRKLPPQEFKCNCCHTIVNLDPYFSRVKNRNHCPYCLWSKHVDLHHPGDRLSACKAAMQPVGLTVKRIFKKYGGLGTGELMLIHRCIDCGKVSINRIAADDDPQTILEIFIGSWEKNAGFSETPGVSDVRLLSHTEEELVRSRLFGWEGTLMSY